MRKTLFMLVGLPLVLGLLAPDAALAADPPSGTLDPKNKLVEWDGPAVVLGVNPTNNVEAPGTCSGAPVVLSCDLFELTVNVSDSQYTATGGVSIAISWASSNSDYDLFVVDESGAVVASSEQFTTSTEQVFIPRASGTYTVQTLEFAVVNDQYHGIAELEGVKVVKKKKPKKK
jgi:hypothetical protein